MTKNKLIEHHVKYKEIHGHDETVWMTQSEHKKLHIRLRNEGKCNVPVDELRIIAISAHGRTNRCKKIKRKYELKNRCHKSFTKALVPNIEFRELIRYNRKTGNIYYHSRFCGTHGNRLPIVYI